MDVSTIQAAGEVASQYISPVITSFIELEPTGAALPLVTAGLPVGGIAIAAAGGVSWTATTSISAATTQRSTQSTAVTGLC